ERGLRAGEVVDQLADRGFVETERVAQPGFGTGDAVRGIEPVRDFLAQARHGSGQLVGPPRRLAEPERDRRRSALRILDAYAPAFHAQDPVRRIAELEDVAGDALDREILVDGADVDRLRFEDDRIV